MLKSLFNCRRSQAATTCDSSYAPNSTQYWKVLLQYYSVLQSIIPVLLCITKYYSSTTLYCKELLQYYSVLQSATPVLLCATKYCFVLQSTTLLPCTAKYYSSTTPYYKVLLYKVLLQYDLVPRQDYSESVLQTTTPVLLCTRKYYSSTTPYCKVSTPYYKELPHY